MKTRRGFTLAEILVAITLAAVVGLSIIRMMNSTQKTTRAQFNRIDAQQSMLAAAFYMSTALREIDASEGDVISANSTSMQFRGMRWTGVSCTAATTSGSDIIVVVRNSMLWGPRAPDITLDSLLVFDENDPKTRADDVWLSGWLTALGTANCTDGTAGTQLTFRITTGSGGNTACTTDFTLGSPIRSFQREEFSLYTDASNISWVGRRTMDLAGNWTVIEKLAGPLSSTSGIDLVYRDTLNVTTAVLTNIASVALTIRTQSTQATGAGSSNLRDSLITRVALRNNKRF